MNWLADKPSGNAKPKRQPCDKPSTTTRGPGSSVIKSFSRPDNARIESGRNRIESGRNRIESGRNRTESGRKSVSSPDGRTLLRPKQMPWPSNSCGNNS